MITNFSSDEILHSTTFDSSTSTRSTQPNSLATFTEPSLPFIDVEPPGVLLEILKAPAPALKTSSLKDLIVKLPGKIIFTDKVLPTSKEHLVRNDKYPPDYFSGLHHLVSAPGPDYSEGTPNHLGARIPLHHTGLNLERWRYHLIGYENVEICQYLEFGFPIGLQQDPPPQLQSAVRNHGSSYQFYGWIDRY